MKLTPLQQYGILGAFLFVGMIVLYYELVVKPINHQIADLQVTLDQKKKELEDAKKVVAKYVEFKKRADSVQRELEWIQNRIPKNIERPKLAEAINLLQNRSGVFLTALQFQNAAVRDAYVEVPVGIKFNTDYKGLLNFLYQVSLSNLFMTVHDLGVVPVSDPAHLNVTWTAQMTVSGIQAK
jgi:Tfp pilus assembly protein PilO